MIVEPNKNLRPAGFEGSPMDPEATMVLEGTGLPTPEVHRVKVNSSQELTDAAKSIAQERIATATASTTSRFEDDKKIPVEAIGPDYGIKMKEIDEKAFQTKIAADKRNETMAAELNTQVEILTQAPTTMLAAETAKNEALEAAKIRFEDSKKPVDVGPEFGTRQAQQEEAGFNQYQLEQRQASETYQQTADSIVITARNLGIDVTPEQLVQWGKADQAKVIDPTAGGPGALHTDEEPPSPEDPTSIHYDDKVDEPPEMNPNPPEEPNHDDQELAAADTAVAEQKVAIYDQVLEKVRSGQQLTVEDKKILQEHDAALDQAEATPAETTPSTALVSAPPPEVLAQEGEVIDGEFTEAGGPSQAPEVIPAPIGWGESLRNRGQALAEGLRNKFGEYRENPGKLAKDGAHLLEDAARAWWNGVMPVDFFEGRTMGGMVKEAWKEKDLSKIDLGEWAKNWKGLNMLFYTGGVAVGAVVDVIAIFPGMGMLRQGVRGALAGGIPAGLGASEAARRRFIMNDTNLTPDEKIDQIAELQRNHSETCKRASNFAHGVAAGMVMGTIVHALGIDKAVDKSIENLFKPKVATPADVPPRVPPVSGGPVNVTPHEVPPTNLPPVGTGSEIPNPIPTPDATFKVVDYHGFWKPSGLESLGEAAHNWGISSAQGSDKQAIIGMILRQNAHHFGAIGDTLRLTDLGPNSQALIDLLGKSPTQADFLKNGGQQLINLIAKGQN